MRRFIVEVVIDALLLLFIALVLGVFSVAQPFPFGTGPRPIIALRGAGIIGFLSAAAILILVNRFARPVLVALAGRLLFSTMGFFVVIINAHRVLHHELLRARSRSSRSRSRSGSGSSSRPLSTPACPRSRTRSSASIDRPSGRTAGSACGRPSSRCPRRAGT